MKRVRIYFNRLADMPLIWSFDYGTQETEVSIKGWKLFGVEVESGMDLTVPAGDREHPRVWMELRNVVMVHVKDDVLRVYGD